jgi:signal transduction histidine kinase
VYLQFSRDGVVTRSTLPSGLTESKPGTVQDVRADGKRYFVFTEQVQTDGTLFTYAKEVTHLDEAFLQLMLILVAVSLAASVLLAVLLYLLLRKLYAPLGNLSRATAQFAAGNLTVRADDSGTDEFSALAGNFNAMADRIGGQIQTLEDTANQRQRMLDDLAHEMRTPLTGIHGYAEYICAARISEEEKIDAAHFIMSESMRLKHISETLLDMAFVRENKISPTELIVKELLILTRDRFWSRMSEKELIIEVEGGDFLLQGDKLLLELMLSNLTENACKACRQGGTIRLGGTCKDGQKVLYVADDGGGMTAEQLAHITTPFYRTDRSRNRKEGGTGLGLALCERIAAAHGAALSFTSALGEGTTAFITFSAESCDFTTS